MSKAPVKLEKRFLRWVVRALEGELGDLADELQLDRDGLVVKAAQEASEVLEPLYPEWRQLESDRPHRVAYWMFLVGAVAVSPALAARAFESSGSVSSFRLALLVIGFPLLLAGLSDATALLEGTLERARRQAARRQFAYRLEAAVEGWLTQQLNEARELSFESVLTYRGSPRLAEVDESRHEIATDAIERLEGLIARMPGGAIGLAGPRGVGKSTLIRSICREPRSARGRRIRSVVVEAPVEYEPRDFILHLFAEVCSELVGEERVARLRGWNRPFGSRQGVLEASRRTPLLVLGPLLMLAGAALRWGPATAEIELTRSEAGFVLLALGAAVTGLTVGLEQSRLLRAVREWQASGSSDVDEEHLRTALVRLRQIWFQQTYSSGWSGGFKAPVLALEGKASAGTELADRQMSYPDVVRLFRDFLELISAEDVEVRIGIDELDKMEPGAAERFLNNIKAVFRVPNCFFFVSVSEDAMSAFERRGVGFRDAFDSSFDMVVTVRHLELTRSIELLQRRVIGLPLPFVYLLHALSGGLPRDLIRTARELFLLPRGVSLEVAARYLIERSWAERAEAIRVMSRRLACEEGTSLLSGWLRRVTAASGNPGAMLGLCRDFDTDLLGCMAEAAAESPAERRELRRLATEAVCNVYLGATALELCKKLEGEDFARRLLEAAVGGGANAADDLATSVEGFGMDIEGAWSDVSAVRKELGLAALGFPRPPGRGELAA